MEQFFLSLFGGVIGGIVAMVIWIVLRLYWLKIISPWYEERIYHDAKIEGYWNAILTQDNTEVAKELVRINRTAHSISGTIICKSGFGEGRSYAFGGSFRNLILSATFESQDRTTLERGSLALMLTNNGNTLRGYCAYYSDEKSCIKIGEYKCNRISASEEISQS